MAESPNPIIMRDNTNLNLNFDFKGGDKRNNNMTVDSIFRDGSFSPRKSNTCRNFNRIRRERDEAIRDAKALRQTVDWLSKRSGEFLHLSPNRSLSQFLSEWGVATSPINKYASSTLPNRDFHCSIRSTGLAVDIHSAGNSPNHDISSDPSIPLSPEYSDIKSTQVAPSPTRIRHLHANLSNIYDTSRTQKNDLEADLQFNYDENGHINPQSGESQHNMDTHLVSPSREERIISRHIPQTAGMSSNSENNLHRFRQRGASLESPERLDNTRRLNRPSKINLNRQQNIKNDLIHQNVNAIMGESSSHQLSETEKELLFAKHQKIKNKHLSSKNDLDINYNGYNQPSDRTHVPPEVQISSYGSVSGIDIHFNVNNTNKNLSKHKKATSISHQQGDTLRTFNFNSSQGLQSSVSSKSNSPARAVFSSSPQFKGISEMDVDIFVGWDEDGNSDVDHYASPPPLSSNNQLQTSIHSHTTSNSQHTNKNATQNFLEDHLAAAPIKSPSHSLRNQVSVIGERQVTRGMLREESNDHHSDLAASVRTLLISQGDDSDSYRRPTLREAWEKRRRMHVSNASPPAHAASNFVSQIQTPNVPTGSSARPRSARIPKTRKTVLDGEGLQSGRSALEYGETRSSRMRHELSRLNNDLVLATSAVSTSSKKKNRLSPFEHSHPAKLATQNNNNNSIRNDRGTVVAPPTNFLASKTTFHTPRVDSIDTPNCDAQCPMFSHQAIPPPACEPYPPHAPPPAPAPPAFSYAGLPYFTVPVSLLPHFSAAESFHRPACPSANLNFNFHMSPSAYLPPPAPHLVPSPPTSPAQRPSLPHPNSFENSQNNDYHHAGSYQLLTTPHSDHHNHARAYHHHAFNGDANNVKNQVNSFDPPHRANLNQHIATMLHFSPPRHKSPPHSRACAILHAQRAFAASPPSKVYNVPANVIMKHNEDNSNDRIFKKTLRQPQLKTSSNNSLYKNITVGSFNSYQKEKTQQVAHQVINKSTPENNHKRNVNIKNILTPEVVRKAILLAAVDNKTTPSSSSKQAIVYSSSLNNNSDAVSQKNNDSNPIKTTRIHSKSTNQHNFMDDIQHNTRSNHHPSQDLHHSTSKLAMNNHNNVYTHQQFAMASSRSQPANPINLSSTLTPPPILKSSLTPHHLQSSLQFNPTPPSPAIHSPAYLTGDSSRFPPPAHPSPPERAGSNRPPMMRTRLLEDYHQPAIRLIKSSQRGRSASPEDKFFPPPLLANLRTPPKKHSQPSPGFGLSPRSVGEEHSPLAVSLTSSLSHRPTINNQNDIKNNKLKNNSLKNSAIREGKKGEDLRTTAMDVLKRLEEAH